MSWLSSVLAFLAGAATALQVAVNSQARIRLNLEHFLQGTLVNFGGGTLALIGLCAIAGFTWPSFDAMLKAPWWIWSGGILGILYVSASVELGPKLGVTLFLTLVVAGQMVGSLLIDEFGFLGMQVRSINWGRIVGVAMVLGGAVLVARSTS